MSKRKGFTLIEMLVVVLIIGILAAIAFPQYEKAVNRTRLTEAFLLGRFFRDAQRMYFMRTGRYADTYEELGIDMPPYGVLVSPAKIRVKKYTYSIMGSGGDTKDRITVDGGLPGRVALLFMYDGRNVCCSYASSDWKGTALCRILGAKGEGDDGCGGGRCLCWTLK